MTGAGDEPLHPAGAQVFSLHAPAGLTDEGFYRRSSVLARSGPLHRARELAGRQAWGAERSYDGQVLMLVALEAVIARTGLPDEYDFDSLAALVAQFAALAEPDAGDDEWLAVGDWVVRSLLGDGDGAGFSVEYGDYRGGYHLNEVRFRLLIERMRADGRVVIEATTEAVNALRVGLDIDVEDAQTAQEVILGAQLKRGDLRGAQLSAEEALRLSAELAAKFRELLDSTRMNLDSVDWERDFQGRVRRALTHVEERLTTEHQLLEHLGGSADVDDDQVRAGAHRIRDLVERCLERHRDLHTLLQTAPRIFLDEQARQSLSGRRRARVRISLGDDLLHPALGVASPTALAVGATFAHRSLGCAPVKLLRLDDLITRMIRPPRTDSEPGIVEDPWDDLIADQPDEVSPANLRAAARALGSCATTPRRLSDLLADADTPAHAEVVRLCALLLFDPEDLDDDSGGRTDTTIDPLALAGVADLVAVHTGDAFHVGGFHGDDLLIGPAVLLLGTEDSDGDGDDSGWHELEEPA